VGVLLVVMKEVCARSAPPARAGPGLSPGVWPRVRESAHWGAGRLVAAGTSFSSCRCLLRTGASANAQVLTLALLVTRVRADDHDPPVAPDDAALLADPFNARLDLHGLPFL